MLNLEEKNKEIHVIIWEGETTDKNRGPQCNFEPIP